MTGKRSLGFHSLGVNQQNDRPLYFFHSGVVSDTLFPGDGEPVVISGSTRSVGVVWDIGRLGPDGKTSSQQEGDNNGRRRAILLFRTNVVYSLNYGLRKVPAYTCRKGRIQPSNRALLECSL